MASRSQNQSLKINRSIDLANKFPQFSDCLHDKANKNSNKKETPFSHEPSERLQKDRLLDDNAEIVGNNHLYHFLCGPDCIVLSKDHQLVDLPVSQRIAAASSYSTQASSCFKSSFSLLLHNKIK